jgi:glutamate carboxypeptidase
MTRALLLSLVSLFCVSACAGSVSAKRKTGGKEEKAIRWIEKHQKEELDFIERVVNINSGTMNLEGVRKVGEIYADEFRQLGMEVEWISLPKEMNRAGHLVARTSGGPGKRIVLIGHLDTVFEKDSSFQKFKREGVMASGPGAEDMKGGNTVILFALRGLKAAGLLSSLNITVVFTGDEESPGAPLATTRKALIDAVKNSDVALGFEALVDHMDTATIARRGFRGWTLRVEGEQGHSSLIYGEKYGYGAIYEASRILDGFRKELAGQPNLTVSAGRILGGTDVVHDGELARGTAFGKSNVIPKSAVVAGDLRALTAEQVERAQATMQKIVAANLPNTRATLEFAEGYPPMAPTAGNKQLLSVLAQVNQDLGRPPIEAVDPMRRGAADISFAAPFVPSMGGLGLLGEGGHSPSEQIDLRSIPVATIRAALLINRLGRTAR